MDKAAIPITRISENVRLNGYVVTQDALQRLDALMREVIGTGDETVEIRITASIKSGADIDFENFSGLVEYLTEHRDALASLAVEYRRSGSAAISVNFDEDGTADINGFGGQIDFAYNVERVKREVLAAGREYSSPIRFLMFSAIPRRLIGSSIVLLSFFLLLNILYYFYGSSVGVDIDSHHLVSGNAFFQEVSKAIDSTDVQEKLNVLLRGQLKGFQNISEILKATTTRISYTSIALAIIFVVGLGLRTSRRLYPLTFFAIGPWAVERLQEMERRREIVGVGVILAFVVNMVAGVVLAFIMQA